MKHWYVIQLWQRDKKLAVFMFFFVLGQAFFSYKQIETLPFFNYGMYARPIPRNNSYTAYRLYNAGTPLDLYKHSAPHFLAYQLYYYQQLATQRPVDRLLRQTIEQRFHNFPILNHYLKKQLTNNRAALPHAQQWISKRLSYTKLSLWSENYVWVKNNFALSTKKLVY